MATKPPKLTFEAFKDKREAVEIWLDQFNDWCILQSWRDTSKPTSDHDHWKEDCYAKEISAFRLGMPPEVLRNIKTTVVPMMGNDDTAADALDRYSGHPWVWQKLVLRHYSGQDTVLAERMTFLDTCKQKPHENHRRIRGTVQVSWTPLRVQLDEQPRGGAHQGPVRHWSEG